MASSGDDLLRRAASGDRDALRALLKKHGPAVRRQLIGRIPRQFQSVLSIDDVMQQTYTDVFLNIGHFVLLKEGSFRAWVLKIANHKLIDALRMLEAEKRGADSRRVQPEVQEDSFVALYEMLSAGLTTPSRHVARGETRTAIQQALQQLPQDYRRVVHMFDLEGRPMEEVAEALGRSPGAAYMLRSRAHHRLRELMGSPSKYFGTA